MEHGRWWPQTKSGKCWAPCLTFGFEGEGRRPSPGREPGVSDPHGILCRTPASPERKLGVDSAMVTPGGCRAAATEFCG